MCWHCSAQGLGQVSVAAGRVKEKSSKPQHPSLDGYLLWRAAPWNSRTVSWRVIVLNHCKGCCDVMTLP